MVFMTFISIIIDFLAGTWGTVREIKVKEYGPNPGWVTYSTQYGGKGKALVRNLDNAKEELEARYEKAIDNGYFEKNPNFKVVFVGKPEKVEVTIFTKQKSDLATPDLGFLIFLFFGAGVPASLLGTSLVEDYFRKREK
jgi:hypothetical protein